MNWRLWLAIALAVVAALIGRSLWRSGDGAVEPVEGGRADYVLRDFELVTLDREGREAFTLRAPRLERDPAVRTLDIATPLFIIPPREGAAGTPWEIRSKTAWVSADGDEIRLRGDVQATSSDEAGRALRMDTQRLNVFPETKRATSDVQVSLKQPGFILNGHTLEAKLDTKRVFLKDIKARYDHTR
jgi:lipopolysaccharide export system protein LptC